MVKRTAFIFTALLTATPLYAAGETPRLDQRQENQQRRIDKGVESGQLNQREAARMERAQERLETNEEKAKADGKVTKRERMRLHREAEVNSARIAEQKHDAQGNRGRRGDKGEK